MPADAAGASTYVVLYQSCPRSEYVRHTALRALCLLLYVYGMVTGIVCSLGRVSRNVFLPLLIVSTVLNAAAVVLNCISLGYRVRHEKGRMRDDMVRAGVGGDVAAQIASMKARAPLEREEAPDPHPPLFLFKYAKQQYWCVRPRRDDGCAPSTDECLEAAERETVRRKRDAAMGKALFAMGILATWVTIASAIYTSQDNPTSLSEPTIKFSDYMVPVLSVSCVCIGVATILVPVLPCTGIDISTHTRLVPTGVMTINLNNDDDSEYMGTMTAPRPKYQEALPGPPLEELERLNNAGDAPAWNADASADGNRAADVADDIAPPQKWGADPSHTAKPSREIWVWGGFANDGTGTGPGAPPEEAVDERHAGRNPPSGAPAHGASAPPADANSSEGSASDADEYSAPDSSRSADDV